jgi:hypothetical protein
MRCRPARPVLAGREDCSNGPARQRYPSGSVETGRLGGPRAGGAADRIAMTYRIRRPNERHRATRASLSSMPEHARGVFAGGNMHGESTRGHVPGVPATRRHAWNICTPRNPRVNTLVTRGACSRGARYAHTPRRHVRTRAEFT